MQIIIDNRYTIAAIGNIYQGYIAVMIIIIANIAMKSDKYSGFMLNCLIDSVGNLLARRIAVLKLFGLFKNRWKLSSHNFNLFFSANLRYHNQLMFYEKKEIS